MPPCTGAFGLAHPRLACLLGKAAAADDAASTTVGYAAAVADASTCAAGDILA